jgi:PucR family transcriptional regulator, purine catabolism regulatory protein
VDRTQSVPVSGAKNDASTTRRAVKAGSRVAYFGALGVHRLLAAVSPPEELAAFFEDVLGPLAMHDSRANGPLLQTLDAYLATGGSVQETAERLHTHRNTVLYRLERIHAILGIDPRRAEEQLTLQLALRAADMMPAAVSAAGSGMAAGAALQPGGAPIMSPA